jgi:hypothetical protein
MLLVSLYRSIWALQSLRNCLRANWHLVYGTSFLPNIEQIFGKSYILVTNLRIMLISQSDRLDIALNVRFNTLVCLRRDLLNK